ncbi:hypothetical protein HYE82_31355 [Streptomyces sp. BR123]|uniref:hypothetical protein n=1 Tax=Streptomyces sp. BR123 TaxID=2749828 RepID=UPI0015C438A9|nr:hypothetical protein [Streptomyces sp. BR123]NXY98799.1 hypothetical protein [Streptomyces sp. BR123]
MPEDPWSSSLPPTVTTFTPARSDMEFEAYGVLVASLGGEDGYGELIAVGPDLTPRRALAAMVAYTRTECSWDGYDAVADLRDRIRDRDLALAIAPTIFTRQPDGGWDLHRHPDGQPAAWLVSPWHPAHCFTTT